MASSKLVVVSPANSDLPRDSSICSVSSLIADVDKQQSLTMDDLLKNIYNDHSHPSPSMDGGASASTAATGRTVEEVWKEIIAGGGGGGGADGENEAEGDADQGGRVYARFDSFMA